MRGPPILAAALSVLVATTACSSLESPGARAPLPRAEAVTLVEVSNHNWSDMVVYAIRAGMRHRLGMVTTNRTRSFRLPPGLNPALGDLRLLADPVGGSQAFDTGVIQVIPGQRIEFSIENHLATSSYAVWNR